MSPSFRLWQVTQVTLYQWTVSTCLSIDSRTWTDAQMTDMWWTHVITLGTSTGTQLGVTIYRCLQNRAPSTWWTAVCVHLTFPVVSDCGQSIGVSWSCHDIVAASSDADCSPLQLRWSGTRFQTPFGTRPNAEHRQLQIDIKDSPVRGATGHVAH